MQNYIILYVKDPNNLPEMLLQWGSDTKNQYVAINIKLTE